MPVKAIGKNEFLRLRWFSNHYCRGFHLSVGKRFHVSLSWVNKNHPGW